jgi:hypothetical protein
MWVRLGPVRVKKLSLLYPQKRAFHNRPFREQTIAPHSAPTVKFTRSALAQEPNVHRGWLYFRKGASPEVSLIYRSLRRRILPQKASRLYEQKASVVLVIV